MIRTLPKPQYRCATCGEAWDAPDLHWHPFVTDAAGKVTLMEGWHCYLCEPNTQSHERVTLDKFGMVALP